MKAIKNWLNKKNFFRIIGLAVSILWLVILVYAKSFFTPYLIIFILGNICSVITIFRSGKNAFLNKPSKSNNYVIVCIFFAIIFALCVCFANYNIWTNHFFNIYKFLILLIGSFYLAFTINDFTVCNLDSLLIKAKHTYHHKIVIFLLSFLLISGINLLILFAVKFPGNLSPDSISEINQALKGITSNHHPYFHILIIQGCMNLGQIFFGNYSVGVAIYSVFSIMFMSTCFSLIIYTLYQLKVPRVFILISFMYIVLMPYHINFSMTMWKDIYFAGFVTLMCLYLYRVLKKVGNRNCNYVLLCISSVCVIIFRSNGFIAYILFLIVAFILLYRFNKKLLFALCLCFVFGMFLRFPFMSLINVKQPNLGEALSIPAQQISRTYKEHNDFNLNQIQFLNEIMDVNKISTKYNPINADPMKDMLRDKNPEYLNEHFSEFIGLYFDGLVKHPKTYFKAWVDQTVGFWNSGYNVSWYLGDSIPHNSLGIYNICDKSAIEVLDSYYKVYDKEPFVVFKSLGFFTWIFLYLLFVSFIRKNKAVFLAVFLNLAVIASLIMSTPIYAEFRYAYCLFCSVPFLAWVTFYNYSDSIANCKLKST